MKTGCSMVSLAQELERQQQVKKDMIVPAARLQFGTDARGWSTLRIEEADAVRHYPLTDLARRQLADKLKIPYGYFERMRQEQPALLENNVNTWLQARPERRLIRTLDGHARAVLSDRYRRLDHVDLLAQVLPLLHRIPELRFESVQLTATKLYLKAVTPRIAYEVAPGDVLQAGVVISNSEVGHGTLTVQPLVYRLVCRNGLIASDRSLRQTHLGRIAPDDADSTLFRDDTLQADDRAFFLKVRDVVEAAVSAVTFQPIAQRLQKTMDIALPGDPVDTVEVLADRYTLSASERAGVLRQLIQSGDLSGYGLVNAVTGYSHQIEDYDRATEFEGLGGRLIDLSAKDWKSLADVH